ncbi:WD40 domain-containing protein [Nocardia goodfellowii]|uniref:WD40 repeat protein/3',5'-cyclic AMP phosphodiesterase CpdA n=1 Tax=Nocardia goodfellowii TaxID=882446 RepID=A0ABS4QG78_9NOCA|nr:TIR domain-containing protein [Nocardia goodfellowii]MBP2190698.1 WD40 repeat protein/3',5'-cyclic AMP phosphodiesterase CpdA [Nocardia goodfellowii]
MTQPGAQPRDFFISYSPADERWATWLAWQLESAGYRTLIQAWDFVPGTNFIDFMDRGVRESAVVVAVLSENYLNSKGGTQEWQATYRTEPGKLLPIRIAECELTGLLATITYVDLVGVASAEVARRTVLERVGHLLAGRAKPVLAPGFPLDAVPDQQAEHESDSVERPWHRRTPVAAPEFPGAPTATADRHEGVSVLHVAGPRFGRGLLGRDDPATAGDLQAHIWANVTHLVDQGVPKPDLIVVTGDLTESARPSQVDEALRFLTGLRVLLGLEPSRLIVVPGNHDVSKAACQAYFLEQEANERRPQPPYFPKLKQFSRLFGELYQGLDHLVFDIGQPWTLFPIPELRVVVAGLNSTLAMTHRPGDDYGEIGTAQAAWFAQQLREFERLGWLRLGVLRHDPLPGPAAAPEDPTVLRDADALTRLLGGRLNLLLHGPGPGGRHLDRLGGVLPVLPAAAPGRDEIVHITPDGLARYSSTDAKPGEPWAKLTQTWVHAAAALPPEKQLALPEAEELETEEPEARDPEIVDPHSRLLERVAEVCETRFPGAKIRQVQADPPHLLIVHKEGDVVGVRRVGVHVGDMTRQVVEEFLAQDPEYGSDLVYRGAPPPLSLREEAASHGVWLRSFTDFQGLLDLDHYLAGQLVRLRTDRRYPPDLYVPQKFRMLEHGDEQAHEDLVGELLRVVSADHGRFVLLLGDFGRGKTFALRELARRITETRPALIPILIELRGLDKSHTVDGLVAAHLANHGEGRIDLDALHYMLNEGRVVLLFDGFDELATRISYEFAAQHLETLLQAATGKAKIIVASRTQHFASRSQVLSALGERVGMLQDRHILSIEPFAHEQIRAFLVNRYGGDLARADDRMRRITGIQDLLGLARNPRMLSFIADLEDSRLRAAADTKGAVGPAGLYREILGTWLEFEARRTGSVAGSLPGLTVSELWLAVTAFALRCWESGEQYLRMAELTDVAKDLVEITGSNRLTPEQQAHAIGAGSLLVRTEENLFGFIHSSVTEWLVANHIAGQFAGGTAAPPQLAARPLSQLVVDFLCDLADHRAVGAWAEAVLADPEAGEHARRNALRVSTRLATAPTADLRGAMLAGADLSYRELRGVDLSDADLSGARLVGANLAGAVLRGARLVGARLDDAVLTDADLSGADLTRARLARTDLTGVRAGGARWHRAALLEVLGTPLDSDLRGAATVPGTPVHTEFAPAAIGVRHGFHARHGRLPQPVAYSPDGSTLAIGSENGGVLIYDTDTGRPLRTLQTHRARTFAVAYTDEVLVTGSGDGTVGVWDAATGDLRRILPGHDNWPWPVVLSKRGSVLATGDAAGVLRMWSLPSGDLLHECRPADGGRELIYSMDFHNGTLAAAYRDGVVRLWDIETGTEEGKFAAAPVPVYRIVFSPSGALLATGAADGTVSLWDPDTCLRVRELTGHTGRVYTLAFHPGLPILASGDTEGGLRLWDIETGETRHTSAEHAGAAIYWLAFDPAGEQLASGDSAGRICLHDSVSGQLGRRLTAHTGSIWPFVFRADGRQLAVTDDQFTTRLWDTGTGICRHVLAGHGRQVTTVRFNSDGSLLAACGNDGVVRFWDPVTGRLIRRLLGSEDRLFSYEAARFSSVDPNQIAIARNDGRLSLYNLATDSYERHITGESPPIWATAYDPTGEYVAIANDDDTVTLWVRTTGAVHQHCVEHRGRVRSIAFNAGGTLMATGCDDKVVRLWDVKSGSLIRALRGHEDRVYAVAFHGDRLASVSWDTTVRIWDVGSGDCLHEITRHTARLWAAAIDAKTGVLATGGDDLVIRLWDMATGRHLHTLEGHKRQIWSLAFDPSGRVLASGADDGNVILWTMGERPADVPVIRAILLGLPESWAAVAPDGRYKLDGSPAGQFWHVIGMSRFDIGELDQFLSEVRQLPPDEAF